VTPSVGEDRARGHLIAFEGLDQSGKQTQAERLATALSAAGRHVQLLSFPDYETAIGAEIGRALRGERNYAVDVMQLLYIANRYEHRPRINAATASGAIVVCDRYLASSIAYGEAQGLDPRWLTDMQTHLPQPSLVVLLDIAPEASLQRKRLARDRYERDLALLDRVRASYRRQASQANWQLVDGALPKDEVTQAVFSAVRTKLALL
jgi:dTMP kinase